MSKLDTQWKAYYYQENGVLDMSSYRKVQNQKDILGPNIKQRF
jgi:hypothetical protein